MAASNTADVTPAQPEATKDDFVGEQVTKPSHLSEEDEEMAVELSNYIPDTLEEKRLVRKVDFILLPCLWWMYVLAYLDRGNIVSKAPSSFHGQLIDQDGLGKRKRCRYERRPQNGR